MGDSDYWLVVNCYDKITSMADKSKRNEEILRCLHFVSWERNRKVVKIWYERKKLDKIIIIKNLNNNSLTIT